MPELTERSDNQFSNATTSSLYSLPYANGSVSANGFWSKHRADVSYTQLQKFWSELSPLAQQELMRIDKPTLCEEARKNMYCSRCNGLVAKGFSLIAEYEKSLEQEEEGGTLPCSRLGASRNENNGELCMTAGCQHDFQDPSVHPWGGLITSRDGALTLMDCYLYSESLKALQNVFDSARARERERELLYPDACGGGGRGWISQGGAGYGRGHGTREACALHNARLSVDTLVDFWSALGEESRQSLLKMKEEDFMEKLILRFDSKRFCRDCRRNVIREFKELKELKRIRRETRCTSWFCVADTCFQYEVSLDTVQADWHQTFVDAYGTYHHFEWAVGTGEGKSDILEFENVGLSGRVEVNGLDLSGLNACYITLRAWKLDGRCTELSVKAHALKGQQCVHCRLVVGDGFVTIRRGETMRRFFEHAEEAEEEEDDDSMDKDGNELDGECSRPQKHAKSPELAREFLLDAATVIFKEQVEKAFRDGTAKQNAHRIFVYLSLKLLEDRIHVACKEIITNAKQVKLLEEEEKERHEEEERKERRKTKEKEKKLRRKERLREKEKDREKKCSDSNEDHIVPNLHEEEPPSLGEVHDKDLVSETGDTIPSRPASPDIQDEQFLNGYVSPSSQSHFDDYGDFESGKDGKGSFVTDHLNYSRRKPKFRKDFQPDPTLRWSDRRRFSENGDTFIKSERRYQGDYLNGLNKPIRSNSAKSNGRINGPKFGERYDSNACSCYQYNEYRPKVEPTMTQVGPEAKSVCKSDASDISKPHYRGTKYNQVDYTRENNGRSKIRNVNGNGPGRDLPHIRRVWEPMESQKKYPRSNLDSDVTLGSKTFKPEKLLESSIHEPSPEGNGFCLEAESPQYSKELAYEDVEDSPMATNLLNETRDPFTSSTSNSDGCSSCLSEGDSNASSNPQNLESSSTSDSEETSQNSEGKETPISHGNEFPQHHGVGIEKKTTTDGGNLQAKTGQKYDNVKPNASIGSQPQAILMPLHAQSLHFPIFQAPSMGYYHQNSVSWPAHPPSGMLPLAHPNHYVFANPFGYDLNGDSHFVPYGGLPHMARPALNHSQVPVYPPVALKDHSKISSPGGMREARNHEANLKRAVPMGPPAADGGPNGNTGFSLFHFGGPVALSNGYLLNPVPSKEGVVGNLSSNVPVDHIAGDHRACDKKDTIEEYNLFAASNGMRFSFF